MCLSNILRSRQKTVGRFVSCASKVCYFCNVSGLLETGAEVRLILAVHRWRVKLPFSWTNLLAHRLNFSSGNAAATHLM
jgi:hypothetical protein